MVIKRNFINWAGRHGLIWASASVVVIASAWLPEAVAAPQAIAGMMGGGMMGNGMMGHPQYTNTDDNGNTEQRPISRGGELAQEFCTQCHALPNPLQHTATEWPVVVTRMTRYMDSRSLLAPDRQQTHEILEYLEKSGHE
jgi:hypothetical protein